MKTDVRAYLLLRAFSLVEVLAAIAVIGIITFLAIPNIIQVKTDGENGLALARAASLNMAMASYAKDKGSTTPSGWGAADNAARYTAVRDYLSFAPTSLTDFQPLGYTFSFPDVLNQPISVTFPGEDDPRTVY